MKTITAFKGFDADFKCRGFQYEVGKTYTHNGKLEMCSSGFHACENPLDVLNYYGLLNDAGEPNRFGTVKISGEFQRKDDGDSKICAASLHVKAELKLPEFIRAAVTWIIDSCKSADGEKVQAATGNFSKLAATGNYSKLAATGNFSQLAVTGNYSKLAATGNYSKLAATGNFSQLAVTGNFSQLAVTGNYSKLAATGNYSQLAATGNYSQLAATGNCSQLAATGNYSQLAATGNYSQLAASGKGSVIASSSRSGIAKGISGTWIALAEYDGNGTCVGFAVGCAGRDVPANKWLKASGGKLVEI